jgi:hypothetical protein
MPKASRTTRTSLGSEKLYAQKAQNFLDGARILFEQANSCRHSGPTHLEAISLLEQLPMADRSELKTRITQIKQVILTKNKVEYEEKPVKKAQAQKIMTQAERIVEWAARHVA